MADESSGTWSVGFVKTVNDRLIRLRIEDSNILFKPLEAHKLGSALHAASGIDTGPKDPFDTDPAPASWLRRLVGDGGCQGDDEPPGEQPSDLDRFTAQHGTEFAAEVNRGLTELDVLRAADYLVGAEGSFQAKRLARFIAERPELAGEFIDCAIAEDEASEGDPS